MPNEFADEEVSLIYGYFSGYTKPKDVLWQSNRLRELFPGICLHDEAVLKALAAMSVPEGMEGLLAVPRWQELAKLYNVKTYAQVVLIVFGKLAEVYDSKFVNYLEREMASGGLRETAGKALALEKVAEMQKGHDLLVYPVQLGFTHRGRSIRRARIVIGGKGFGFGAYEGCISLLLHPERLQNVNDLWMDLPGDEVKPDDEREFSCAPSFLFDNGKVAFIASGVDVASDYYGSASAFLPQ